jgi:hypothetical protein
MNNVRIVIIRSIVMHFVLLSDKLLVYQTLSVHATRSLYV